MGRKRRHHFVPQVLTRQFAPDQKFVYLYDFSDKRICRASTKDVFVGRDIYSFFFENGVLDTETIENKLSEFERRWSDSLADFIYSHGQPRNRGTIEWISTFIAFQYIRTPTVWRSMSGMLEASLKETVRLIDERGDFGELPDVLKQYGGSLTELFERKVVKFDDVGLKKRAAIHAFGMVHLVTMIISRMSWTLLLDKSGQGLVVSDNPISVFDPIAAKKDEPIGLCRPNIELILPIHRHVAILLNWRDESGARGIGGQQVREINQRSAFFAERFLISHIHSRTLMRQLLPYGKVSTETKTSVYQHGMGSFISSEGFVASTPGAKRVFARFRPLSRGRVMQENIDGVVRDLDQQREHDRQKSFK